MDQSNTKGYWNSRFSSGSWTENGGPEQTRYFAQIACSLLPDFVRLDLLENSWTIVDVGCAEGEAAALLAEQFPDCHLIGQDFSEEAVRRAKEKYPGCDFASADIYEKILPGDVVFSSNTLEHLENPLAVMKRTCQAARKYAIFLLPFEDGSDCAEHINLFQLKNFPLHIGSFYLEYSRLADCADIEGDDWRWPQILLVYTNSEYRPERMTLQEVHTQYGTTYPCVEELSQKLEMKKQDLYRLLSEKDAMNSERNELQKELRKAEKDLAAAIYQEEEKTERLAAAEAQRDQAMERLAAAEVQRNQAMERLATVEAQRDQAAENFSCIEAQRRETEERIQRAEEENARIGEQLALLESKNAELEEELKQRNYYYDDLYAYSARRDRELEDIKNSRSYRFFLHFMKRPLQIGYRMAQKIKRMIVYLFTLRWGLLGKELVSPFHKIILRLQRHLKHKKMMSALSEDITGRNVIIFPPTLDWHMMLFQRPQQLASSYAKKPDMTVIYLTANLKHDHVALAEKAAPHLWLVFSGCFQEIIPLLGKAKKTVMSLSWTINKPYIDMLGPDKLIYEYIDELEIFDKYDEKMLQDHQTLMGQADVTVCTATKLFEQAKGKAKNPMLSPNAGDYAFFTKTETYEISPLLQEKVEKYQCVLGYYGALASWFDYGLIMEAAHRKPDWLFVLVGMDYDGSLGKSGIQESDNIIYIPPQPYRELPRFLKAFDIATIPFAINEITLSTSPVKLFEYMAAGKPILTSRMPECLKYESVKTYKDVDEFCALAEELLALKPEDPYWEVLKREALENTWDARTDQILKAIGLEDI